MEYFNNQFFLLALTFGLFFFSKFLQKRTGWVILNPILLTIAMLIIFLKVTGISYETYNEGGHLIEFWLKPAVVALGVPLYLQLKDIRKQLLPIIPFPAGRMLGRNRFRNLHSKMAGCFSCHYYVIGCKVSNYPYRNGSNQERGWHSVPDSSRCRLCRIVWGSFWFSSAKFRSCSQSYRPRLVHGNGQPCRRHFHGNGTRA